MKLEVHMSMDSAAFDNGPGPLEVSTILHKLAKELSYGWTLDEPVRLQDTNGNRVGYAVVNDDG